MTQDDKGGGVWVWNGPKIDDVIYEQPLRYANFLVCRLVFFNNSMQSRPDTGTPETTGNSLL